MPFLVSEDFKRDLLARTDMLALIGPHTQLKRSGSSYKGLCPLHREKTPSFHVRPEIGTFKCFGCGKGGDAITFLRELQGYSFMEALEELAARAGVNMPEPVRAEAGRSAGGPRRQEVMGLLDAAQAWFRRQAARSDVFKGFLSRRGVEAKVAERFGLGLAGESWDGLLHHLRATRQSLPAAVAAGLVVPRSSGDGHYDRFRNRVMFPVHDLGSRVVGFSGRTLSTDPDANEAKYINSPESSVYRKGKLLFGLPFARAAMREGSPAVLVEGNIDVVALHQAGFPATVAPLGTALTAEQSMLLRRFAERVVVFYDGDDAGATATQRAMPLLLGSGFDVLVARPPRGSDPAELAVAGDGSLSSIVASATPGLHYLCETLLEQHGTSSLGRGRALAEALTTVTAIGEEAAQHEAAWTVHRLLGLDRGVSDAAVRRRLAEERRRRPARQAEALESAPSGALPAAPPPSIAERHLAALLAMRHELADRFVADGGIGIVEDQRLRALITRLAPADEPESPVPEDEPGVDALLAEIVGADDVALPKDEAAQEALYLSLLQEIELRWIDHRKSALQLAMEKAESSGDLDTLSTLRAERMELWHRASELRSAASSECNASLHRSQRLPG